MTILKTAARETNSILITVDIFITSPYMEELSVSDYLLAKMY